MNEIYILHSYLLILDEDPVADYNGIKRMNALKWMMGKAEKEMFSEKVCRKRNIIKMKFYDREKETETLQKIETLTAEYAQMTVVTGRRRIGKATL